MNLTLSLVTILGGVVLLCAFLQIPARRIAMMLLLCRLMAFALAGEAVLQAVSGPQWSLYGVAVLVLLLQGIGLNRVGRDIARHYASGHEGGLVIPPNLALLIGLLPVCLAVMSFLPEVRAVMSPVIKPLPPAFEAVMIAFAVVLLGLWLIIVKKQVLARTLGFVVLADGLTLVIENLTGLGGAGLIAVIVLLGLGGMLIGLVYGAKRQAEMESSRMDETEW